MMTMFKSSSFNTSRAYVSLLHCYAILATVYCLRSSSLLDREEWALLKKSAAGGGSSSTTRRVLYSESDHERFFPSGPNKSQHKAVTNNNGIFPMLREMNCGHANLEVPRLLSQRHGRGRLVIDVGLGMDAAETKVAVDNGFNVIAFELLPGNIASLKNMYANDDKFHFISLEGDAKSGWRWPAGIAPLTPTDGRGTVYIVHAGLGPKNGAAELDAVGVSLVNGIGLTQKDDNTVSVPVVTLDEILPEWVTDQGVFFWKIDTQGYELQIFKGALKLLQDHRFRYIQFEFSPWIMKRNNLGDKDELVTLLPSFGAICFDTMTTGSHNPLPHPVMPISAYTSHLDGNPTNMIQGDPYGPWDDITCYFPGNMVEETGIW